MEVRQMSEQIDPTGPSSPASGTDGGVVSAVSRLVAPILVDLGLELYDCEFAGGVLRVTIDTPPGGPGGVDMEKIALVTRLLGRELDHPADGRELIPGRYTLEVSSPGLERRLRTPAHFAREIGKEVSVRFAAPVDGRRRVTGLLVAAADDAATVRTEDGESVAVPYHQVDKAKVVFVWEATPKPGKSKKSGNPAKKSGNPAQKEVTAS
jgi:ribosome maturation factor RimP